MKYALVNGIILDGTMEMEAKEGYALLVDDEKIAGIVKDVPEGYEKVDVKGEYIMPGLINLHVHMPANGKPKKKATDPKKVVQLATGNCLGRKYLTSFCKKNAKTQLMSGVTTIRAVGGVQDYDAKIRDMINAKTCDGPRMLVCNMAISVPGGHMAGSLASEAHSPEEAAQMVQEVAKGNPDQIKLMITGGVLDATVKGEPGVLRMQPEIVKAACDEAHKLGYIVAAHVESTEGVKVALENGVDTIEHGATPTEEIINLFKEKKAAHVATISPALPFALFDRSVSHASELAQFNGNLVFEGIINCANECLKNNIPVGLGTDTGCPFITHYDMWREVNYFQKYCNVSNAFALYTATLGNAKIVHIDDVTGSLEEGKYADIIVMKENPLEDLKALRNISMVIAKGKRFNNPRVKKMQNVEEILDQYV